MAAPAKGTASAHGTRAEPEKGTLRTRPTPIGAVRAYPDTDCLGNKHGLESLRNLVSNGAQYTKGINGCLGQLEGGPGQSKIPGTAATEGALQNSVGW